MTFLEKSLFARLIGSADGPPPPLNCVPNATGKPSVLNGCSWAFRLSRVFLMWASNPRSFSSGDDSDPCPGQETGSAATATIALSRPTPPKVRRKNALERRPRFALTHAKLPSVANRWYLCAVPTGPPGGRCSTEMD